MGCGAAFGTCGASDELSGLIVPPSSGTEGSDTDIPGDGTADAGAFGMPNDGSRRAPGNPVDVAGASAPRRLANPAVGTLVVLAAAGAGETETLGSGNEDAAVPRDAAPRVGASGVAGFDGGVALN